MNWKSLLVPHPKIVDIDDHSQHHVLYVPLPRRNIFRARVSDEIVTPLRIRS